MADTVSNIRDLTIAGALGALALLFGLPANAQDPEYAVANLHDENGNLVGTVGFGHTPDAGLWVTASFPAHNLLRGQRAIHLHERGACEPDFFAAGGHFDPFDRDHGVRAEQGMHAGDFPNLHFPQTGPHVVEFLAPELSLREGEPGNIFAGEGTAVVLHAGLDDYRTQPTGNAGDRVACGVVEPRE